LEFEIWNLNAGDVKETVFAGRKLPGWKKSWQEGLPPSKAGVVATGGVFEVVIEYSGLTVEEGNLDERQASHHGGVPLLHHPAAAPLRIFAVNDPVADLQVQ